MSVTYLNYKLQDGYIHNWLVAGPQITPITNLSNYKKENLELEIVKQYYIDNSGVNQPPVDLRPIHKKDQSVCWRYYRCLGDHFIDFTKKYPTCFYLRSWAFSELKNLVNQKAILVLTTNGPADLWLNNQHIHRQEHLSRRLPLGTSIPVELKKGVNKIQIRFENAGVRETPYVMALKLTGLVNEDVSIQIPTEIEPVDLDRRRLLENVIDNAYLDQDVYGYLNGDVLNRNEPITVRWQKEMTKSTEIDIRLQDFDANIYMQGEKIASRDNTFPLAKQYPLNEGIYHMMLLPQASFYYLKKLQYERYLTFHVIRNKYSQQPYGTFEERRKEALENIAWRKDNDLYTEIAKMSLKQWERLKPKVLQSSVERINRREDGSVIDLIGLIGIRYRFWKDPAFPKNLKAPIEACILNYKYWQDEPGDDIMSYQAESKQILFHACEGLAGQLYPNKIFTNVQQTGKWHQKKGEKLASEWLVEHCSFGFQEWDSDTGFEDIIITLSHLIDLASSTSLKELAAVMMDKLLFSISVNSFKGSFSSTRGRSQIQTVKSTRLEAIAGISRLMWGMGIFNTHTHGTVSLALVEGYQLPEIIQNIAADNQNVIWNRECHSTNNHTETPASKSFVNKVTLKTSDYMLSSAQDYHPGEPGHQEIIWQATMGSDAVVFVNHPACFSENEAHRPNFWTGNVILPRAAQWGSTLIAIHKFSDNDWLGFTHAHFPIYAFDEYIIRDGWAFARKGNAYLGLTACQGFDLIIEGDAAYRELRSYGCENIWLCEMGQAASDGSFLEYQDRVASNKAVFNMKTLQVQYTNLRGEKLSFGWKTPLLVNGTEQPITGYKHYENPYTITELGSTQMDIVFQGEGVRLDFNL